MNKNNIIEVLKQVKYPGFSRDIVSFGLIKEIQLDNNNILNLKLQLTTENPEHKNQLTNDIKSAINSNLKPIEAVNINYIGNASPQKQAENIQESKPQNLAGVKNIIAVASGKGGVGKSTIAVNLASELSKNYKVGILDLDIYGPSLPMVVGISETPKITPEKKLIPIKKFNMKLMSFGFVSGNDAPTIWRGPLVSRMTQQFFDDVIWGELDFLILDLPPGTGDIQLTLVQKIALTGAVIVTTPQDLAVLDVQKGADMFKKVNTPVLGIIENMSNFNTSAVIKNQNGELINGTINIQDNHFDIINGKVNMYFEIFSGFGGDKESKRLDVPLLGSVPLSPDIVKSSDNGEPYVLNYRKSLITETFKSISNQIIKKSLQE
ncbi:MAG: chromosome partitioning protein [Candidatus Marinimicrobia bacterium]|nr:chromosome partitioning protein [Candidatus Neomarinimicrobiota bacterium]|tara:strand:- start:15214 stop:16347 length:1134 start_codon:yes stop_codon:yes gene_type:complete